MKQLSGIAFPETQQEALNWRKPVSYKALHHTVLAVFVGRIEGAFSVYITPVPGKNHSLEQHHWRDHGSKLPESIARAIYPELSDIPYAD